MLSTPGTWGSRVQITINLESDWNEAEASDLMGLLLEEVRNRKASLLNFIVDGEDFVKGLTATR